MYGSVRYSNLPCMHSECVPWTPVAIATDAVVLLFVCCYARIVKEHPLVMRYLAIIRQYRPTPTATTSRSIPA
jgi:hypothetical protein